MVLPILASSPVPTFMSTSLRPDALSTVLPSCTVAEPAVLFCCPSSSRSNGFFFSVLLGASGGKGVTPTRSVLAALLPSHPLERIRPAPTRSAGNDGFITRIPPLRSGLAGTALTFLDNEDDSGIL